MFLQSLPAKIEKYFLKYLFSLTFLIFWQISLSAFTLLEIPVFCWQSLFFKRSISEKLLHKYTDIIHMKTHFMRIFMHLFRQKAVEILTRNQKKLSVYGWKHHDDFFNLSWQTVFYPVFLLFNALKSFSFGKIKREWRKAISWFSIFYCFLLCWAYHFSVLPVFSMEKTDSQSLFPASCHFVNIYRKHSKAFFNKKNTGGTSKEGSRSRVLISFIFRILIPEQKIRMPPTIEISVTKASEITGPAKQVSR